MHKKVAEMLNSNTHIYDAIAPFYDEFKSDDNYKKFYELVLPFIGMENISHPDLWEVGTGTGKFARYFARDGFKVFATDISQKMIELACNCEPDLPIHYEVQDVTSQHPDKQFDVVVALDDVFNSLSSCEQLRRAIRNIAACLTPGGVLIADLVGSRAFRDYLGVSSSRESENYCFTLVPDGAFTRRSESPVSCRIIAKPHNDKLKTYEVVLSEYYYPHEEVASAASSAGLDLERYLLLKDGVLVESASIADSDEVYKAICVFRKRKEANHGEEREAG